MSAKIYNGFIFPDQRFPEVDTFLRSYRAVVAKQHKKALCTLMARGMMHYLDDAATQELRPGDDRSFDAPPMMQALSDIWDRQKKLKDTGRRDPEVDFEFELWVFFHQGTFYGIAQCEQQDWLRAFFRQPAVKRFPYWDNSDKPDNLSQKDWDARGRLWTDILGPSGIPSDTCWTLSLSRDAFIPQMSSRQDRALLKAALPGWDERVTRASKNLAWLRWMSSMNTAGQEKESCRRPDIMDRLWDFREYATSEEGQRKLQSVGEEVQAVLLRDPAMEVFLQPPQSGPQLDKIVDSAAITPKL